MQQRTRSPLRPLIRLAASSLLLLALHASAETDVALSMSVDNAVPGMGDPVAFSVSVTNSGPDDTSGMEIFNPIPAGLVYVGTPAGDYNPGSGIWNIGVLPVGAVTTLVLQMSVAFPSEAQPLAFGDVLTNTALLSILDQSELDVDNNAAAASVTLTAYPRTLTIVSAHGTPSPAVGVYTNMAGTVLTNTAGGHIVSGGTQLTCVGWTMTGGNPPASGTTNSLVMTVHQDAVLTWLWTTNLLTDVRIGKSVDQPAASNGVTIAYTVIASNAGSRAAAGVVVQDVLPAGVAFVSSSSTNYDDGTGLWAAGTLAVGAATSLTISAVLTAADGETVTNRASLHALAAADTNAANDSAIATTLVGAMPVALTVVSAHGSPTPAVGITLNQADTTVDASVPSPVLEGSTQYLCTGWTLTGQTPASGTNNAFTFIHMTNGVLTWLWQEVSAPELDVAKTVGQPAPGYGETITYTVSVTNRGNATATDVLVADQLPIGLELTGADAAYDPEAGSWSIGTLPAGAGTALVITAMAPLPQVYALERTVTNPAPLPVDNFGVALADADGSLLVGAPGHPSGNPFGRAYLFASDGLLAQTFTNPAPGSGERFGQAVAAVGGRLAIAAPGEPSGNFFGGIYVFDTEGTVLATITNPTPEVLDQFGDVLAAVGTNGLLVGASHEPAGANAGAAYLYDLAGGLRTTFANPNAANGDRFGAALAAAGKGNVLVGAPGAPAGSARGAVHLFDTGGVLLVTFTNPAVANDDEFGGAVAGVGGSRVLIGADGAPAGAGTGVAYLYSTNGTLLVTFTNPAPASYRRFGATVADLGGGRIAIGALGGPGGGQAGAVFVYDKSGTLLHTFANPGGDTNENFAASLAAVAGRHVAVGADGYTGTAADQGRVRLFSLAFPDLAGTTLTNTASVTLGQTDPLVANNSASAEIVIATVSRTLTIVSEHGTTLPPAGVHTNPTGFRITNTCPAQLLSGTNQYVCVGWTMTGNAPSNGTTNVMTMVPVNDATLTWLWITNVPADVAVAKSVDDATPGIGDTVSFTLSATNQGFVAATGLVLADALPTGLVFVAASSDDYDTNAGTWTVGILAAAASTTMTLQATVALPSESMPVLHGATLTNSLSVAALDQADADAGNDTATAVLAVVQKPRTFTIVSAHGSPVPGAGIYTNLAGTTLTNSVASPLLSGSTQYTCTGWTLTGAEPAAGGTNSLVATPYQDAVLTWLWTTNYRIDVAIAKSVDETQRDTGETLHFTLVATNAGPHPATGLVVNDLLPTNLLLQAATSGDYDGNSGNWTIGPLEAGAATTLVLTVQMGGAPYFGGIATTNRATVVALDQIDTLATNDTAEAAVSLPPPPADVSLDVLSAHGSPVPPVGSTFVPHGATITNSVGSPIVAGEVQYVCTGWVLGGNDPEAGASTSFVCTLTNNATLTWLWQTNLSTDVHITKSVDNAAPPSGGLVAYTIVASNAGANPAMAFVVEDVLPAGVTFTNSSSANYSSGTGLWNIGALPVGASTSLTIEAIVTAGPGATVTNIASLQALAATDTNPANNAASALITAASSEVTLAVLSPYGTPTPSQGVHTNPAGTIVAASVPSLALVGSTQYLCTGWSLTGNSPASGTTNAFTMTHYRSGTLTWNWVEVFAPDLAVGKSVDNTTPGIGDTVQFTLSVTNQGNAAATGVQLRDALPAGLVFLHADAGFNPTTGVWNVGALAAGAATSLTLAAEVIVPQVQTLVNTAAVLALDQSDVLAANNSATIALTASVTQRAFTVVSAHGDPNLPVGVSIVDSGTTVTNSVASPILGSGIEYVCTGWTLTGGDAPASGTSNTMVTTVYRAGTLTWLWVTNIATDVAVAMSMDDTTPVLGQTVQIVVTATNQGPQPATGLTITNRLASGLAFVSSSSTGYVAGTGIWTLGTLAPAATTSLTISATVSNGLSLVGTPRTNSAAIASLDTGDTDSTNNTAEIVFVPQSPVPLWTLTILSDYGTSVPAVGVHTNIDGSNIALHVDSFVNVGSTQFVCAGWSLTGQQPDAGGGDTTAFVQTNHATFTWHWTTNFALAVVEGFGGTVNVTNQWIPSGQATALTATAGAYFTFSNWTGDVEGGGAIDNPLMVTVAAPRTVQANFTPLYTTNRGLALWWLAQHGLTNDFEAEAELDQDADSQFTWQEYIATTDPTNPASFFATGVRVDDLGTVFIEWLGASGRVYDVEAATDLELQDWMLVDVWTNLVGTPPLNTVTNVSTNGMLFYRATGRMAP